MVNTSILLGVALATLINVVAVTASKKPSSLDATVWTANDTNLIPEEEFDFDQGSLIAERKKCLATRQCTNAGGSCIKSRANCDGTVNPQRCKGKKCKCCIPNLTTTTTTCPNCPSCPTIPESTTIPECPTIPDQTTTTTTCPSCPTIPESTTIPECPTIPDLTTTTTTCPNCPSCPTIPESTTIPECPTIPDQTTTTTTCPSITCPSITCPSCPTIPVTTTATTPTTTVASTTRAPTTTTIPVPAGFEVFHERVIRRTIRGDTYSTWDTVMGFCNQFGAKPFIPRTVADYALYKTVRAALSGGHMWLPANDRDQEGTLRWYNGELDTNISLWNWYTGQDLYNNRESYDCLLYHPNGGAFMYSCTYKSYPPICEMI